MAPPTNPAGLAGHYTPVYSVFYPPKSHVPKQHHLQALAWSVEDALGEMLLDSGQLPPNGNEGDHLVIDDLGNPEWVPQEEGSGLPPLDGSEEEHWHIVLQDDGKGGLEPIWAPHEDSGGGTVGWHEISRGTFQLDSNTVSMGLVHRPTDAGVVDGHGAINNIPAGPPPTYWLAETPDATGDSKLHTVDGGELILSDPNAEDHRITAIVDGTEYAIALSSGTLKVADPDGSNMVDVPAWAFTAAGLPTVAPQTVEVVVEAFGGASGGGESWCPTTYGELAAGCDGGGSGGGGGGSVDLQPLLDRIAALESLHASGEWKDH